MESTTPITTAITTAATTARRRHGSRQKAEVSVATVQDLRTQGFGGQDLWTQGVLCILLMRSALDLFSGKGVPAAFAIAVDLFVLLYLGRQLILRKSIYMDRFGWMLLGWVLLQAIWVALLPTGALGGTAFMSYEAMREWVRFFSLGMVYVLTMQLRDRISPDRLASLMLLSLVVPSILAILQIFHAVPGFLESDVGWKDFEGTGDRINSTLGHYNSFATFCLLFISLSMWRMQMSKRPWVWAPLVGALLYCLIATKSLTGLVMLLVFGALYFLPRLRGKGLFGAIALTVTLSILLSSELGQERLMELGQTPLLNPDLSVERAMALQAADMAEFRNSFNWRLLQWRDLLLQWQRYPMLGYGLASTKELSVFHTTSHNDYVRFLFEEGLVGLGLFWMFLLAQVGRVLMVMRKALPDSPQRALCQAMFPFSVALMVGMAAGNVMVHTALFFYWWVLLALINWPWPAKFGGVPVAAIGAEAETETASETARGDRFSAYSSAAYEEPIAYENNYLAENYPVESYPVENYPLARYAAVDQAAVNTDDRDNVHNATAYDAAYDAEIYQSDRYDLDEEGPYASAFPPVSEADAFEPNVFDPYEEPESRPVPIRPDV